MTCGHVDSDMKKTIRKCIRKFTDEGREDFALVAKELEEMIINQNDN